MTTTTTTTTAAAAAASREGGGGGGGDASGGGGGAALGGGSCGGERNGGGGGGGGGGGSVGGGGDVAEKEERPPASESVEPTAAFDVASLVLYGSRALPIRLKILLDQLFNQLQHAQVTRLLAAFGWTYEDYTRGYILQVSRSTFKNPKRRHWVRRKREREIVFDRGRIGTDADSTGLDWTRLDTYDGTK